jgi:hypothetical protein
MRICLIGLVVLSALNVFAKSADEAGVAWVTEPKGCLQREEFPCAIVAIKKLDFNWSGMSIVFSPNASLVLTNKKSMQFLKGDFFVDGKLRKAKVGAVEIEGKAKFLLRFHGGKSTFRILQGEPLLVSYRGESHERLPAGFENWYQGVGVSGNLNSGVMKPYETDIIFPQVAELMIGTKSEKVEALVQMRKTWTQSRDLASTYYGREVQQELNDEISDRVRQAEARRKQSIKEAQMRKLFRQKNNFN